LAVRVWEVSKTCFCDHIDLNVELESQRVYPAEWLPEQPARVTSHRCSHGLECNQFGQPACVWAGTNPVYDPFQK
jgi:hypothetical protein